MFDNLFVKWGGNAASVFAIIGTMAGWLPYIAAVAALVWYIIQIWESQTIQNWHNSRVAVRRVRQIAKLKAKEKLIAATLEALHVVHAAQSVASDIVATAAVEAVALKAKQETDILANPPLKSTPSR